MFRCPTCRIAITRPLFPLGPGQSRNLEMGQPAIPEGYFEPSSQQGTSVVVNVGDVVNTKHHQDHRRLAGCMDGHEVGTERSDCWTPHYAVLI